MKGKSLSKDINTIIEVDLDELLEAATLDKDGEGFLNLLETLVQAEYSADDRSWSLINYTYKAVGFNDQTRLIQISIIGDREDWDN